MKIRLLPYRTELLCFAILFLFAVHVHAQGFPPPPPPCSPPSSLVASVDTTSVTVTWTAGPSSSGYGWIVDTIGTVPPLFGSGTTTTLTNFSLTGLTPGTNYYVWIYSTCNASPLSAWAMLPFATNSSCASPTLTISAVTSTSGAVDWAMEPGVLMYLWVVDTLPVAPTSSVGETATVLNSLTQTGLTSNTNYWAHVRDSCGVASRSAWVTIPFTTIHALLADNTVITDFSMTAYPSPVRDALTIEIKGNLNSNPQIQLIDVTGKLIKTNTVSSNKFNIEMSGMPAGIYFIRYIDAGHTQTIILRKG